MNRYIDADALIKALNELQKPHDIGFGEESVLVSINLKALINVIKEQPTADVVEVVHGSWVVDEDSAYIDAHCSECGMQMRYNKLQQFDCFCRRCGAKMDGER